MYIAIISIIVLLIIILRLSVVLREKVSFFSKGLDSQFSISDLKTLWKVARLCGIEEPTKLYYSEKDLNSAISRVIELCKADGTFDLPETQKLLSKVYDYRTKIAIDEQKFRGILSSRALENGQKLNILLSGRGVFTSEVVNNGKDLIVSVPKKNGAIIITGEKWIGKKISVYLWRKSDASYVFDTKVLSSGAFLSKSILVLCHSDNLERMQKRQSIRCNCEISSDMYILKPSDFASINYSAVETLPGYKVILLNISESGALIKVGGHGYEKMAVKLQFELFGQTILMYGIVLSVEFDEKENISLMHFECTHLDSSMRNVILGYVYNIVPLSQKEKLDAMELTKKDEDLDMEEIMRKEDALLKSLPNHILERDEDDL